MNTKKSLLMTGASGLVGSRFVEMFSSEYEISNIDLTTGVDITNQDSIREFVASHPAEAMIHLAAFTNTAEAYRQQGDKTGSCYQVNVQGTKNIAQACAEHGMHLIHVSTDFVFDGTKTTAYTEEDPVSPIDWYGETKAMAEQEVAASGASYTISRISYPYRANFTLKPDIVKKILTGLRDGTLPPQFSDSLMTPTFVDDIARGFRGLIEKKLQGIYHLTGSTVLSPFTLAGLVARIYELDVNLVKEGSLTNYLANNPRPFARNLAISNAKITSELGLLMATAEEGIKQVRQVEAGL